MRAAGTDSSYQARQSLRKLVKMQLWDAASGRRFWKYVSEHGHYSIGLKRGVVHLWLHRVSLYHRLSLILWPIERFAELVKLHP